MQGDLILEYALAVADAVLLAAAAVGFYLLRGPTLSTVEDVESAFRLLDRSVDSHFGTEEAGYTWSEAFERLKGEGVEADWAKMANTLSRYEAFRYGGGERPTEGKEALVTLALKIRGDTSGKRPKAESPRRD